MDVYKGQDTPVCPGKHFMLYPQNTMFLHDTDVSMNLMKKDEILHG